MEIDEPVMISAIEHYSYCPRQCALIHVEQVYEENLFTLRGTRAHERADIAEGQTNRGARVERALPLWSDRLGLVGRADVVEIDAAGRPYPIEYKHGPRRQRVHDDLQLCAQAVCLEEMLGVAVERGAIYHVSTHRRREVTFTPELRRHMEAVVATVRRLLREGMTPEPVNDARCPHCSLKEACLPAIVERPRLEWHLRDLFRTDASETAGSLAE